MTQRTKNLRLLIAFVGLVVVTAVVGLTGGERTTTIDKSRFTLGMNTVITQVHIQQASGDELNLEYVEGSWKVNGTYELDESMRDVFFAVLSTIEVRKVVSEGQRDSIRQFLRSQNKVTVRNNGELVRSYFVGGDRNTFTTYMMDDSEEPYEVRIPGYVSYISGIYEAALPDWRARYIWSLDWSGLKEMEVVLPGSSLRFEYSDSFVRPVGIDKMDTVAVMDYLQYVANLQATSFVTDNTYDDLLASEPYGRIRVGEIGNRQSELEIYEIPSQPQHLLGLVNGKEKVILDRVQIESLAEPIDVFSYRSE